MFCYNKRGEKPYPIAKREEVNMYNSHDIMRFVVMAHDANMEPGAVKMAVSFLMEQCNDDCKNCPIMEFINEYGNNCYMAQYDFAAKYVNFEFQTQVEKKVSFYIKVDKDTSNEVLKQAIHDSIIENKEFYLFDDDQEFEILIDEQHPFTISKA